MAMTVQQKRGIQWGTVISLIGPAVVIGAGLYRPGGKIAVTQSIAVRNTERVDENDKRSHNNEKVIAEMRAYQVTIITGLGEIKTELRAMR